jgi:plasmid maintenance system killer protein
MLTERDENRVVLDIAYREYTLRSMWTIVEARDSAKALDKLPRHVAEKYAIWCAIVRQSGPHGLRAIKSFHDEKLAGKLANRRSSRLSDQWRVLYHVEADSLIVYIDRVTPHNYRP